MTLYSLLLSALALASLYVGVLLWQDTKVLNQAYQDMNNIEYLSSSTQRVISLTVTSKTDEKIKFVIRESTDKYLTPGGADSLSVFSSPGFEDQAQEVVDSWILIQEELDRITLARAENEPVEFTALALFGESHFQSMTQLSQDITVHSQEINHQISQNQLAIATLLFIIGVVMFNHSLRTRTELKLTKELAEVAQIDTATGLYNRSRCQDLFKTDQVIGGKRRSAVLVMDLNDLKITNDTLGHRTGDDLINGFACALKEASSIHMVAPFIGRYGGDEFLVYYEDVPEDGYVERYLKELQYLVDEFNNQESRFQISYAVGCALVKDDLEKRSVRQLFDQADEEMYKNKIEMKQGKGVFN